jgi:aerobic-type carbon monoxide dehydrogenase small subunit (CoxS/CutS family)
LRSPLIAGGVVAEHLRQVKLRDRPLRNVSQMAGRVTRRDFLKGTGGAIAGVAMPGSVLSAAERTAGAAADGNSAHAGPREILLDVNGARRAVRVEPQMTLAEVLRGPLDLTGTKIACDRGACSACTVWIDQAPVLSCMMLAVDVGERKVVTIEGLARGATLHPVQSAFIARDAMQCGFCTPGLVMSCAALLAKNPAPSVDDVNAAISGHLCRCGSTPHVVDAVLDAAAAMKG